MQKTENSIQNQEGAPSPSLRAREHVSEWPCKKRKKQAVTSGPERKQCVVRFQVEKWGMKSRQAERPIFQQEREKGRRKDQLLLK